jgi:superfamily II DNA or RNA helicase
MATGLGKTFVAAASIRRYMDRYPLRKILVLAHTNELVYQLERAFWPFLTKQRTTAIWNGIEKGSLETCAVTFACIDSVHEQIANGGDMPTQYDLIVVDEAHHAGSSSYRQLFEYTGAGRPSGAFLLGLTATPWRSDEHNIEQMFQQTLVTIDMVEGMKRGYLSNVDYRMHVDNIDWQRLHHIKDLTPRGLNRVLFIQEWDDAVVHKLAETWSEQKNPRAIVFCGNIDHALTMRDKINSLNFTRAEAIYSRSPDGRKMDYVQRTRTLSEFHDGRIGVVCAVDIFNEGVDVPDVNILVFQRVTHSRRIFIQQLGRGLRISPGKDKVIVLDFVSDIRRFAAGLDLKSQLASGPQYITLGSQVRFVNVTGDDPRAESFLREWLKDAASIQDAGEDDHILRFPPESTRAESAS